MRMEGREGGTGGAQRVFRAMKLLCDATVVDSASSHLRPNPQNVHH